MNHSIFSLFRVGIGPSSSHTVGPMRAARLFAEHLQSQGLLNRVKRLKVELFGSLALTGLGHGTDRAVLLGLEGHKPEEVSPDLVDEQVAIIRTRSELRLLGRHAVAFDQHRDLVLTGSVSLPAHPNGMRYAAYGAADELLGARIYYSVGGGFVTSPDDGPAADESAPSVRYPFTSAAELLQHGRSTGLGIAEIVRANERAWRSEAEISGDIASLWGVIRECIDRGLNTEGTLPGALGVQRRASRMHRSLLTVAPDRLDAMDWVPIFAMAVNEENAAGGRIVTAPTNGAAGVLPAVLEFYRRFTDGPSDLGVERFFLTAGAVGLLYKTNASISGAEVGCQGEVGVACSMAAAGLVAALGGDNGTIEQAAEIGMEHHLGLTCDPVGGLVQIPCIERNGMGAVKAITAARLAMRSVAPPRVSLDQVIHTMRDTGRDMQSRYKETSLGGLAVNVVEC